MSIKPIQYHDGICRMIDQRLLPTEEVWLEYTDYQGVAEAIQTMVVRGAPAIGVAAAFGAAFGARDIAADDFAGFAAQLEKVCSVLAATRPTAVNLFWALERMQRIAKEHCQQPLAEIKERLLQEALNIAAEDEQINRTMGANGAPLIADGSRILTHCNAGALATGGYGTALGVIRAAVESGKKVMVYADETRPFLQGSRLTAWELHRDGIPVTLICDNMAGALMNQGKIDCVIVGADRIAANGDVANKIGTYTVAVLAKEHNLPFYVAAPISTIDPALADGSMIPIEERDEAEVTHCAKTRLAPEGIGVRNPAFDVTPARLVSAIITERGVARGDYRTSLAELLAKQD
ncbi:S-methyl-5-thioribose-1-phosphate isomerase [Syntrophotalea acetylenivorans]|uniref:Methylthioribose-1-phosphate isomerase n=1 Tax=Syntrophotalea acetylenivorans TaxID=1842532 RepID=A0A1L3GSG5_9BACT|nr:S-methyl-5-thioribose-1-phosphate isomerase [Syntrophotalea acetylenivorans]APG28894.1 S-methyl-5-thioribose-1-phosphate isomerase [Syntrophotalea acetylenivorans]